jgi:hypothetical protein
MGLAADLQKYQQVQVDWPPQSPDPLRQELGGPHRAGVELDELVPGPIAGLWIGINPVLDQDVLDRLPTEPEGKPFAAHNAHQPREVDPAINSNEKR